jgi:hypothetical protein
MNTGAQVPTLSPNPAELTLDIRFNLTAAAGDQRGQAKLKLYQIRENSSARSATPDVKYTFTNPLVMKNHDPATLTPAPGIIENIRLRKTKNRAWALYPLTYTYVKITKIKLMGSDSIFSMNGFYDSGVEGVIYFFANEKELSWWTGQAHNPAGSRIIPLLTIETHRLPYIVLKMDPKNSLVFDTVEFLAGNSGKFHPVHAMVYEKVMIGYVRDIAGLDDR